MAAWAPDALFYGVLLGLAAHQLLAFARERDGVRLAFAGFIASLGFSFLAWGEVDLGSRVPTGLGHDADAWNRSLLVAADATVGLSAAILARSYLRTHRNARNLDALLRAVVVLASVSIFLARPSTWALGFELVGLVSLLGPPILLTAGAVVWRAGDKAAPTYLLAHACLLAGWMFGSAGSAIPASLASWSHLGPEAGTLAMAWVMAQGVAQRQRAIGEARDRRASERSAAIAEADPHDRVTGLWNQKHFDEHVQALWRRAVREDHPVALVRIEVDGPRPDATIGEVGLRAIAGALAGVDGLKPDDRLARHGANAFTVVLPGSPLAAAEPVAEAMRMAVESLDVPPDDSSATAPPTVSVGVAAAVPLGEVEPKRLRDLAEEALRTAQRMGGNRVCTAGQADATAA